MRPVRRTRAFLDLLIFAEQHRADLVFFEVHRDAGNIVAELDQFARHDLLQAVDAGDAVAHRDHRPDFGNVDRAFVILNLLAEDAGNFVCSDVSHNLVLSFRPEHTLRAPIQARFAR